MMKVCPSCRGAKSVLGMGMMKETCSQCKGNGIVEDDEKLIDEFLAMDVNGEKESIEDERSEQEQIETNHESGSRGEEIKSTKRTKPKATKTSRRKK
jgi:hypothetical protein